MGRQRKRGKNQNPQTSTSKLKDQVIGLLDQHLNKAYSVKQIAKRLGYHGKITIRIIPALLSALLDEGKVERLRNGSFKTKKQPVIKEGIVDHVNQNYAYIEISDESEDVWVKNDNLKYALDGDTVKVAILGKKHGLRNEGKIIQVIKRGRSEIVGRMDLNRNFAFVIPDNRKIYYDIFVPPENYNKAKDKDKVILVIEEWPSVDRNPKGKIIRVLGPAGEHETEIHSIMAEFGLPFTFPRKILEAAKNISSDISGDEISKRRDFRSVTTFTIDPEDAKDFDDALSIKELKNGNLEIGVHIADVTHYVKESSIIEKIALERATSVYLVDRTIPMLPEKLSNELCSLKPEEDKLTFSAVFELTTKAEIKNQWFGRSVIHSNKRFTYEQAQEGLTSGKGEYAVELHQLNELAKVLGNNRYAEGSVKFETVEVKFHLDETGNPLGVVPKIRQDAHKLIEEFMLLANKKVAEFVYGITRKNKHPFVYRTHDNPDPEKLQSFAGFAKRFGHDLNLNQSSVSSSLNNLMDEVKGTPEQNVLESLAIRAMAKAIYTTDAKGHFGLAFPHYTHFTSPIRRYPDMMVHRLLDSYLGKKKPTEETYEEMCEHSSSMEKRAADAERASIKYKQVEYIEKSKEKEFQGIITGVTEWGIFVEMIENKCEGMVRLTSLKDDYYEFDPERYCVIGSRSKKIYTLGDPVKVRVIKTDIDRRTIDLKLI